MHTHIHTTSASGSGTTTLGQALALRPKEGLPVQPRVAVAAMALNARSGRAAP